jgi:hypothetical protein
LLYDRGRDHGEQIKEIAEMLYKKIGSVRAGVDKSSLHVEAADGA